MMFRQNEIETKMSICCGTVLLYFEDNFPNVCYEGPSVLFAKKRLAKHVESLGLLQKSIRKLTLVLSCQSKNDMATNMELNLMKQESSRTTGSCRIFLILVYTASVEKVVARSSCAVVYSI
jgi:hypothetical protein